MYFYISESESFTDFSEDSLFWAQKGLVYGDWESGPNRDGTHEFAGSLPTPEVTHSYIDTLRLHYNAVHGKRTRVIYMRPLFKIFNATSFTGFHIRKTNAPPIIIWYGATVSVFSFMVITHKLFINRGINRFTLVD